MFKKKKDLCWLVELDLYTKSKEVALGKRSLAFLIDLIVIGCLWGGCYLVGSALFEAGLTSSTADYVIPLFYFLFRDGFAGGQSIGKKAVGIMVVDIETGLYCDFVQSFFRNTLGVALFLIDWVYSHKKFGAKIGDIWARTIVSYAP